VDICYTFSGKHQIKEEEEEEVKMDTAQNTVI
jgi:hypothetical protein